MPESTVLLTADYLDFDGRGYLIDLLECRLAPEHVVEVVVYEATRTGRDENGRKPDGFGEVWVSSPDGGFVGKREDGVVFLKGQIKWDGCSDWDFHPGDCNVHFCDLSDIDELCGVMKHAYKMAANLMNWPDCERKVTDG